MSNLQLIEELCKLVEEQAAIIRKLYLMIAESDAASVVGDVQGVEKRYSDILGSGEISDSIMDLP